MINHAKVKSILLILPALIFFFVATEAKAEDEGYYGFKSRKVVTEALANHPEVSEQKRAALLEMLSNDGYFWLKTKEAKLQYIHANLASAKYLSIVADAENIHSWNIKPTSTSDVTYNKSQSEMLRNEFQSSAKLTNEQIRKAVQNGEQGMLKTSTQNGQTEKYVVQNGVKFRLNGWLAVTRRNDSVLKELANELKAVQNRVNNGPLKMSTTVLQINSGFTDPNRKIAEGMAEYSKYENTIVLSAMFFPQYRAFHGTITRIIDHEYGHLVQPTIESQEQDSGSPLYNSDIWHPPLQNGWSNAYSGFMDLHGPFSWFQMIINQEQEYRATDRGEFFAENFREYMNEQQQIKNSLMNADSIYSQPGSVVGVKPPKTQYDKMVNLRKYIYEYMATVIDGSDPKYHPFTHKPIKKLYTKEQILNGSFLKN